ncbi:MAG TPA: hypothetical protein DDW17_05450 [Deltaproteobacteria bacterium]|nr:hypothetical protein [Deltaproteobacteria bacterium]
MKIIVSHDIDHLSVREHIFKDLIIQKYLVWSLLELIKKKISLKIFSRKIIRLFKKDSWNNLGKLLKFDQVNGVDSTFFVAVNNGKGLSYSLNQAKTAINLIKKYDFDVGVHGICFDNYEEMRREYEVFKEISNLNNFGIRMHYLRLNQETLENLAKIGYLFDTTILSDNLEQEYKIDELTEIPFHIMDGNLLGPRQNLTLEEAKEKTMKLSERAEKENKKYVALLFHQRYFSEEFPQYKNWYFWLIDYCRERKYEFVNYKKFITDTRCPITITLKPTQVS